MGLPHRYGPADDDESITTIHKALDRGVTLLDTAMSYGAGHNERLVGAAVAGRRDLGVTPGRLALAWLLAQGLDVAPIPGGRRLQRVAENVAAAPPRLSPTLLGRFQAVAPHAAWSGDRFSFAVATTTRQPT